MTTEYLFSIDNLPNDQAFLKSLLAAVNAKLGNKSVNLHDELVENMEVARRLRNRLCDYNPPSSSATTSTPGNPSISHFDDEEPPSSVGFDDVKDSSRVASVRAFTDIIEKLVKMQEVVLSQQGVAALQGAVVEVLLDCSPEFQAKVMTKFRERISDLEGRR